ncbi:DUF2752 domain-containing protein [Arcticibacter svalbardensis]|uniref:DUF2752 domain-containing protein n=1 Tax=Arcticibacter svalbardensis TaxID=1288027 RepID=UPI00058CD64B|nr:DUF2752 domain-containing protein [Arcticibacter svalbardensis]
MIHWLQNHLLPCPFKYLTGIDCPGCGFQRSVVALLQCNLHESLEIYPATIPILILLITVLLKMQRFFVNRPYIKDVMLVLSTIIITASYLFKLSLLLP